MIRTGTHYDANILMMCGDLTGKAILPIVRKNEAEWYCTRTVDLVQTKGNVQWLHSRDEVEKKKQEFREMGYYPFETTPEGLTELAGSEKKVSELVVQLTKDSVSRWIEMVKQQVPKDVTVIVNPGNDDDFAIDEVIRNDERVVYPLDKVVPIGDRYEVISCAHVNPTPWQTPRECSEQELAKLLQAQFDRIRSYDNLICNFHCPPYNTTLDIATKIDKNWRPVNTYGMPVTTNVGSTAVREAIEKYQPLLSLHGHIHESCGFQKIGRTLCLNPGSEYSSGILRGYVIDLAQGEIVGYQRVEV
jgi:Icc-related predicted phosphoesterase